MDSSFLEIEVILKSKIKNFDKYAEHTFARLCSAFGAASHSSSREDVNGWDVLVEFPKDTCDTLAGMSSAPSRCFVQVKSSRVGETSFPVTLSNAEKAACATEPWFLVLFTWPEKGEDSCEDIYVIHIWKDQIKETLKKLHQKTLTFNFEEVCKTEEGCKAESCSDVLPWIRAQIKRFEPNYAEKKKEILKLASFELFQRGHIRQAILSQMAKDPKEIRSQISKELQCPTVRAHIKAVIFQTLNLLENPTLDDWKLIKPYWTKPDHKLYHLARQATWASKPWLEMLERERILDKLMRCSNDNVVQRVIGWLHVLTQQCQCPEIAAKHVLYVLEKMPAYNEQSARLLYAGVSSGSFSADFMAPLKLAIGKGMFDHDPRHISISIWFLLEQEKIPDPYFCELLSCYLKRLDRKESVQQELSKAATSKLTRIATEDPVLFIESLFQDIVNFLDQIESSNKTVNFHDYLDCYRGEGSQNIYEVIYNLALAIGNCCSGKPDLAFKTIDDLVKREEISSDAIVLLAAEKVPSLEIASRIVYLITKRMEKGLDCEILWRLDYNWARAFKSLGPYVNPAQWSKIENLVLNASLKHEYNREEAFELFRYPLLSRLPESQLSGEVRQKLGELKKKFNDKPNIEQNIMEPQILVSPRRYDMSDEEWLQEMGKDWPLVTITDDGTMLGGAQQLASELGKRATAEPGRFTTLFLEKFDDTIPEVYWTGIVRSVAKMENLCPKTIDEIVQKSKGMTSVGARLELTRCIEAHVHRGLGDSTIHTLMQLAMHDTNPNESDNGVLYQEIDPEDLNSVRGVAAYALGQFISTFPKRYEDVEEAVKAVLNDECLSVRAGAIYICMWMLKDHPGTAVQLFLDATDSAPRLWTAPSTRNFMQKAVLQHWEKLQVLVRKMVESEDDESEKEGAVYLSIAWLNGLVDKSEICQLLSTGSKHQQRMGVAQVCLDKIWDDKHFDNCKPFLVGLFQDEDEGVRNYVGCGFLLNHPLLDNLTERQELLLSAFVDSPAFNNALSLFRPMLQSASVVSSTLVLKICDALINSKDLTGIEGNLIFKLIVKAYHNSPDIEFRRQCLDKIDALVLKGVYGLDDVLTEYGYGPLQ